MAEATATPLRVKEYETIYVLRPDIDPDGASRVSSRVSDVIGREAGTLVRVESWGRRKLAYPVRKFRKGVYIYVRYLGAGEIVAELERNLRMQKDAVLKFMTVKVRDDVVPSEVQVDPEEVKFAPIEPMAEDEGEETREKLLGLVEAPEGRGRWEDRRAAEEEEEGAEQGDEEAEEPEEEMQ